MAHQRKVSYMLARSYEDVESRLQAQLRELDAARGGAELKPESHRFKCKVDSEAEADRPSCSCDHAPVVADEHEDKTESGAGSQIEGEEE